MSIKRTELIDAYLRNELDSEGIRAFENELAGDPTLQEELGFQQQVVKGLGEFRKAELKSRLTAINISTPWWEVGQILNPGLVKMTGAIVTAAFVGTGIFYFSDRNETKNVSDIPTVFEDDLIQSEPNNSYTLFEETSEEAPKVIARLEISSSENKSTNSSLEANEATSVIYTESTRSTEDYELSSEEKSEDFVPEVALPNPGDGTEKVQFKSESAEIPLASNTDIINDSEQQIDIKTIQRSNEDIRYKYYEGKLHLYGDFKNNPYEILEINSTNSRQVYLYHNRRYYKLLTTDKILNLPQITDQLLIQELEIVRNNKAD